MSEKLLPCPFCGPENSCVDLWHDDVAKRWRVGCGACGCSTGTSPRDKTKAPAIAAWNRRTPAPEGEAWRTVPVEPTEAMIAAGIAERHGQPVPEAWSLATANIYAAMLAAAPPVVPVGASREEIIKAVRSVLDRPPMIDSSQSHKLDIQAGRVADAILAALGTKATDAGRAG